jgi:hypothetical protein
MPTTLADTRDGILLTLACVFGALIAPVLPVVGFPVCGAALAGLVYRSRLALAVIATIVALAVTAAVWWTDVLVVGPALIAVVFAASRLGRSGTVNVAVALVPVFALGFAASELARAWMMDLSVRDYLTQAVEQLDAVLVAGGAAGSLPGTEELVDTMIRFMGAGYLVMAVVTVVPTLAAIVWAARRSGVELKRAPALDALDLSPHVLWTLVGALAFMAAGRLLGNGEGWVSSAGLNLLIAAKIVLFAQGLGVLAAGLKAAEVGRLGRTLAYAVAVVLEGPMWIVSIVGLLDFWVNFRKLARETPSGAGQAGGESPLT